MGNKVFQDQERIAGKLGITILRLIIVNTRTIMIVCFLRKAASFNII